jgi:hypothetical protein
MVATTLVSLGRTPALPSPTRTLHNKTRGARLLLPIPSPKPPTPAGQSKRIIQPPHTTAWHHHGAQETETVGHDQRPQRRAGVWAVSQGQRFALFCLLGCVGVL